MSKTLGKRVGRRSRSERYALKLGLAKLFYDGINGLKTLTLTLDLQGLFVIFRRECSAYQGEKETPETMDRKYDNSSCFCYMSERYIMC